MAIADPKTNTSIIDAVPDDDAAEGATVWVTLMALALIDL